MRASCQFPEDRDHLLFICAPIARHPAEGLGQSKSSSSEYFLNNFDEQSNEEVGYPKERNMEKKKKKHGPSLLPEEITIQLKEWPVSNTKRGTKLLPWPGQGISLILTD